MTDADVRARRAAAQVLHRPDGLDAEAVVGRLLGVQAQDGRAARLALRARGAVPAAADVDRALGERRLVIAWLMRGTLHLVRPDDLAWLLGLTAPTRVANSRRRLGQEGVGPDDAERAVTVIEHALLDEGPLTRPELAQRIAAQGIRTEGQAMSHLLGLAALRGIAVLGPPRDGAHVFAHARDWLGMTPPAALDGEARDAALAELARRYLAGHGPATAADLAGWAGLAQRDARAGLAAIAADIVADGELVDLARRAAPEATAPRLLGAFDPYLLGWRDRGFAVPAEHARRVHPGGGIVRAVALDDRARVAATWRSRRSGGRLAVTVDAFGPMAPDTEAALEADAADVARFEGLEPA